MLDRSIGSTGSPLWIREEDSKKNVAAVTLRLEHTICQEFNAA